MRLLWSAAFLGAALLLTSAAPAAPRDGGVSVSPMMVILDTRGRPVGFDVINFSDRPATFRLDPLHAEIGPDGAQTLTPAAAQPGSAVNFLRWAPRQFEVQPGATRTIRLSARPPADLPAGEYRLHLRVTNIGPPPERPTARTEGAVGVAVHIQVAQAVRVLVRHGVGPGSARLDGVAAEVTEAGTTVRFALVNNHDGGSVLGRYAVVVIDADGAEHTVSEADVTLYPDTDRRPIRVTLPPQSLPPGSRACVSFRAGRGGGTAQRVCSAPVTA